MKHSTKSIALIFSFLWVVSIVFARPFTEPDKRFKITELDIQQTGFEKNAVLLEARLKVESSFTDLVNIKIFYGTQSVDYQGSIDKGTNFVSCRIVIKKPIFNQKQIKNTAFQYCFRAFATTDRGFIAEKMQRLQLKRDPAEAVILAAKLDGDMFTLTGINGRIVKAEGNFVVDVHDASGRLLYNEARHMLLSPKNQLAFYKSTVQKMVPYHVAPSTAVVTVTWFDADDANQAHIFKFKIADLSNQATAISAGLKSTAR